jgi:ABC-type transport system involved in multi-copper enzyme maturation permease subunit
LLGPIFNREWLILPRRPRHYFNRAAWLGLLWILGLTAWLATPGWSHAPTLGEAARLGRQLFWLFAFVQLSLLLFFAAVTAASAITQEKDRRTFILLLVTELRDHEIVLGKLLGSLLQIGLLVLLTVPILFLLLLLGSIAPGQILEETILVAATVLAAGSLGGLIALWRESTFQALALTILSIVLYLCLVFLMGITDEQVQRLPTFLAAIVSRVQAQSLPVFLAVFVSTILAVLTLRLTPARYRRKATLLVLAGGIVTVLLLWFPLSRWELLTTHKEMIQTWLNPYRALQESLETPREGQATLVSPAYACAAVMVSLSVLLNAWGIAYLRIWNPSGEPIMQRESPDDAAAEEKDRLKAHAAPGLIRQVWANPILWREIRTRAYGRRPRLVKTAYFVVLALVCYYALAPVFGGQRPDFVALRGLVPVGILSLLLLAAQAVTSITSERDIGALDLLLVTDLTPREFIFGKLGGIAWNVKEYLLPPLILAILYAVWGLLATPPATHPELLVSRNIEALLCVLGAVLVLMIFAVILGIHVALRTQNSRLAIVNTLGTIFFLSVGTGVCLFLILINGRFEYQWTSFVLFIMAGIGGLWWVLSGDRPSTALTVASWVCPLGVFYSVTNILVAKPGTNESGDPVIPFLVMAGAFGFTVAAMLIPLISEFDVAMGRTSGGAD